MNYKRTPVVQFPQEGWHKATILGVKPGNDIKTMYGMSPTALISFKTDEGYNVTHSFFMAEGMNELLENLLTVTLGSGEEEEEMSLYALVDLRCGIRLEHSQRNDRMYANVAEFCLEEELQD